MKKLIEITLVVLCLPAVLCIKLAGRLLYGRDADRLPSSGRGALGIFDDGGNSADCS
jgi:hypothetical protein